MYRAGLETSGAGRVINPGVIVAGIDQPYLCRAIGKIFAHLLIQIRGSFGQRDYFKGNQRSAEVKTVDGLIAASD
jgi:hypothetical protein